MTPQEFKSWLVGFMDAIEDVPTKSQWEKIKEKVVEIEEKGNLVYWDSHLGPYKAPGIALDTTTTTTTTKFSNPGGTASSPKDWYPGTASDPKDWYAGYKQPYVGGGGVKI